MQAFSATTTRLGTSNGVRCGNPLSAIATYNKGHSMSPHILKLIEAVTTQDPKTLHEIRMNELAEKALKEMESLEAKTYTSADNVAP